MHIPVGFAQINLKFAGVGIPNGAEVTVGCEDTSGVAAPLAIAESMETALEAANTLFAATISAVHVETIRVKKGSNESGPFVEHPVDIAGTSVTLESMPNCAYLVHKSTLLGGRHGRGRLYWPGPVLSEVDNDGEVGTDARNGVTEGWEDIRVAMDTAGFPLMLLHATSSPSPTEISSFSCDNYLATQRRRLRG